MLSTKNHDLSLSAPRCTMKNSAPPTNAHTIVRGKRGEPRKLLREGEERQNIPNKHLPNPPCHGTTHPLFRIPQQHIKVGIGGSEATAVFHAPLQPHDHWGPDQGGEKGLGVNGVQRAPAPCLQKGTPADQRGARKEELESRSAGKKSEQLASRNKVHARRATRAEASLKQFRRSPHRHGNSCGVP